MSKFEQIGVDRQYSAHTTQDATRSFNHSCTLCCEQGKHISCEHCAIACAHSVVLAILEVAQ